MVAPTPPVTGPDSRPASAMSTYHPARPSSALEYRPPSSTGLYAGGAPAKIFDMIAMRNPTDQELFQGYEQVWEIDGTTLRGIGNHTRSFRASRIFNGDPDTLAQSVYNSILPKLSQSLEMSTSETDDHFPSTNMLRISGPSKSGKSTFLRHFIPLMLAGVFSKKRANKSKFHVVLTVIEDAQREGHTGKVSKWGDLTHCAIDQVLDSGIISVNQDAYLAQRCTTQADCSGCGTFTLKRSFRGHGYELPIEKCRGILVEDEGVAEGFVNAALAKASTASNSVHEDSSRSYVSVCFQFFFGALPEAIESGPVNMLEWGTEVTPAGLWVISDSCGDELPQTVNGRAGAGSFPNAINGSIRDFFSKVHAAASSKMEGFNDKVVASGKQCEQTKLLANAIVGGTLYSVLCLANDAHLRHRSLIALENGMKIRSADLTERSNREAGLTFQKPTLGRAPSFTDRPPSRRSSLSAASRPSLQAPPSSSIISKSEVGYRSDKPSPGPLASSAQPVLPALASRLGPPVRATSLAQPISPATDSPLSPPSHNIEGVQAMKVLEALREENKKHNQDVIARMLEMEAKIDYQNQLLRNFMDSGKISPTSSFRPPSAEQRHRNPFYNPGVTAQNVGHPNNITHPIDTHVHSASSPSFEGFSNSFGERNVVNLNGTRHDTGRHLSDGAPWEIPQHDQSRIPVYNNYRHLINQQVDPVSANPHTTQRLDLQAGYHNGSYFTSRQQLHTSPEGNTGRVYFNSDVTSSTDDSNGSLC